MEEDQEQRFVCKICSKSFINGKCLGGHMRGHASEISARNQENSNFGDKGLEDHDDASYGLRENPKKTWRVSNGIQSVEENRNSCKECGRDFPSLRALSGHLRSHSNKEKEKHICKQCGKGFASMRALFGHMRHHSNKRSRVKNESVESQTDYETVCPIKKKRSKLRYKIAGNSVSNLNPSLKFSEIDEEEEAALCLLMLSSGLTIWFDFVSECSSSENDLLMAKAKALQGKDISKSNSSLNSSKKFEYESGDLDCGYFENNEKEAYLGVSSDGFHNNNFGIKFSDSEIGKGSETTEVELGKELGLDQADSEIKSKTGNEVRFDDQDLEFGDDSFGGINISDSVSKLFENAEKKPVFKCKSCNKIFHSCRALGGHRASHKPITNSFIANSETKSELETDEHLDEMEIGEETMTNYELKKNKDHECPICFKVFSSGQALGGHKRAHYKGSSGNKIKERMVTNQELGGVIDLNLLEKEVNSDAGLKPWFKGMKWNELELFL